MIADCRFLIVEVTERHLNIQSAFKNQQSLISHDFTLPPSSSCERRANWHGCRQTRGRISWKKSLSFLDIRHHAGFFSVWDGEETDWIGEIDAFGGPRTGASGRGEGRVHRVLLGVRIRGGGHGHSTTAET
jgi:hypothetical protein